MFIVASKHTQITRETNIHTKTYVSGLWRTKEGALSIVARQRRVLRRLRTEGGSRNTGGRRKEAASPVVRVCPRIGNWLATFIIKLLGRWHSDAMMRYLHQDCTPVMQKLSQKMYNKGNYSFLPTHTVPVRASLTPASPTQHPAQVSTPRATPVRPLQSL